VHVYDPVNKPIFSISWSLQPCPFLQGGNLSSWQQRAKLFLKQAVKLVATS